MEKIINCLNECEIGDSFIIKELNGTEEQNHHLQDMGLFKGARVELINKLGDNCIVSIFSTRIALNSNLSTLIYGSIIKNKPKKLVLNKKPRN